MAVRYTYDASGTPMAVTYGGTTYYYATNLQGDVLGMVKADGTTVATYTYDPYGKPLTATGTFAATNPLRYRGYVYDTETGLYYLQSRYYDPTTARFLNADAFASTGQGILGNNMFAYCLNNPVNYEDDSGAIPFPSLGDYYWMHRAVQFDIVERYGFGMEVFVSSAGKIGYLDIYDASTHSYYEVKHVLAADAESTENQMKKYDDSHIAGWRWSDIQNSEKLSRGTQDIKGFTEYMYWDISYELYKEGLIIYRWKVNQARYTQFVATAAVVASATICSFVLGGATQGAKRVSIQR